MAEKNMNAKISVEFEEAASRQSLNTGDNVKTLFGKLKKWLADLKPVAFSGSYNDLSDKPESTGGVTPEYISKQVFGSSYFLKQLYCPYENREEITASGTWEVPEGVTEIELILVGGGGGGGLTVDTSAKTITVTTKGAGEALIKKAVSVAPGDTLTITVGAGGAGGDGSASLYYRYGSGITGVSGTSCTGSNGGTTSCKVGSATYSARGGGAYTATDGVGDVYSGEIFGDGAVGDESPLNGVQWKSVSALGKAGKASVTHNSDSYGYTDSYTTVAGSPGGVIIYY